jgi:hypothetical protein
VPQSHIIGTDFPIGVKWMKTKASEFLNDKK